MDRVLVIKGDVASHKEIMKKRSKKKRSPSEPIISEKTKDLLNDMDP
jgi:hypothetical protein